MNYSAEKLAATQDLWDTYRSIYARKGLDIASRCTEWARRKRQSLEKYSAGNSFDELCRDGCKALPLVIVMATVQPLRSFEKKWKKIAGSARQREQAIRTLEKAAVALEGLLGSLADVIIADDRSSMGPNSLKELRQELIRPIDDVSTLAMKSAVPDPAIAIDALRTYASVLSFVETAQKDAGVSSSDMLAKYLMSAYVFRATDRFHDEQVSALIGNALSVNYDETAHRVWRNRNYKRIDKKLSSVADILTYFAEVSAT